MSFSERASALKQFFRKNGLFLLMLSGMLVLLVSPTAKSWFLRQLLRTGMFNASISDKKPESSARQIIDFLYRDENGRTQHIANYKGKVVLINFWASWCPPCRAEFPSVQSLYNKLKDDPDIIFLTFNEDENLSAARTFLDNEGYTVPFLKVLNGVPEAVFTGTLPTTVILDKTGSIRYHHEGMSNYDAADFIEQIKLLAR
ncbi:TlpA family protein disulfide reductase [Mucilaginibacter sp. UR6-1]|uniref:TlpA disulfide reductase family protein n=1 Tax=Mucilaginibacter sp. UR6-1 TaxID=1435643 RepID=UPI001E3AE709|nr:TlpA disulfide reductase family protein [Mucilaginibacter sp. UR6-1]MCC8409971.1 TlpA family protein disulfide reductase [Mucilaginibacter sp. UR6-1]